jgi:hypothetical protein
MEARSKKLSLKKKQLDAELDQRKNTEELEQTIEQLK